MGRGSGRGGRLNSLSPHKTGGIGPLFYPTGDIDKDMIEICAFYAPFKGKYPDQFHAAVEE